MTEYSPIFEDEECVGVKGAIDTGEGASRDPPNYGDVLQHVHDLADLLKLFIWLDRRDGGNQDVGFNDFVFGGEIGSRASGRPPLFVELIVVVWFHLDGHPDLCVIFRRCVRVRVAVRVGYRVVRTACVR